MASNLVSLQHYRSLGIDRSPNTGIYMLNEQAVVYFAGNNIVLHNLDTREQRFLAYTDTERGDARCVAVTANATLMAFALELDASIIHMIDLQSWSRRQSITLQSGWSPTPFSALAFSGNGKFLIAQGASADATLFYFDIQKGALVTSAKVTPSTTSSKVGTPVVTCISFNPNDPQFLCCTGRGIFRQFTKNDKGLLAKSSSMAGKDSADFKSHIWTLDGRTVIVAMADGKLSQVDSSSVLIDINITNPTGGVVTHLTATQKGFACVTGGTRLHFFERTGEKGWQETSSLQVDEKETIAAVSLAQADDHITVLLSDARLLSVPLSQSDQGRQGEQGGSGEAIVTLLPAHHIGSISGLDVAFRKQLLVSCGEDHAIRVWNYEKMQCENAKFFQDQPLCISFHPNGGCIVAGFAEKLRYMAITINDIVTHREFPIRGCRECRFSHGGQYFAAVNGNNVQVYSSYTFKSLVNLRSPGQRVKTIAWSTDDNVLVSCDANGSMTLHTVRTGKQRAASNAQSFYFTSIVCLDAVGTKCIGVSLPDNVLRVTEDCATRDQLDVVGVPCHVALGPNGKCIFVSTRNGTVLTYCMSGSSFPTTESAVKSTLHHSPVTALVTSPDNQYLFTAGEDACIYMMRVIAAEVQTTRSAATTIQFSEDILIARSELVDQLRALRTAQQAVVDLDKEQKYKLDSMSQGFKQKRKEIKEKIKEEQASEQANADELMKQITALNEDAEAQRTTIETQYKQEMQQKMLRFEMNMANEQEQQEQLKKEKEEAAIRGQEEYDRVVAENNRHTEQITLEFEQTLADLEQQRTAVGAEKDALKEEFNQWEVAIGRELAFEIGKREYEAQQQRELEKVQTAVLIEKSEAADSELNVRRQNVTTGREGLLKQTQLVAELKDKIMKAKNDKEQLQKELTERKDSINEKQIKIEELTNKNITLEKHRQLVRDRIADRKKELEPKLAKQQDLAITHDRMRQELERYEKNDEQLRLELNELRLKIEAKRAEIEVRTKQLEDVKQITRQFKLEAHTVHEKLQEDETKEVKNRKQFAPSLAALYRKYVGDEAQGASSQKKSKVTDIQVERNRERDALERNITAVARRINRGDEEHARQHTRMMEENVMLMTQISELRRQNENLVKRQRVLEESSKSTYTAEELNKILEMQKDRIAQLTEQLKQLQLRGNVGRRVPVSRERLPPMNATDSP
jgi:WD40 repeat protein